jgi:hypothetical protein
LGGGSLCLTAGSVTREIVDRRPLTPSIGGTVALTVPVDCPSALAILDHVALNLLQFLGTEL